jgi:hypothetical protein
MQTNDHKIRNYDIVLDAKFGKRGTVERAKFEDEAYAFYVVQFCKMHESKQN